MQIYDIIMLVILLVTVFMGYRKGLAWQIASLSAIFVSYFVAINFRDVVAQRIDAEQPWNSFFAMLILYIATSLTIWFLFQIVKGVINQAKLKDFDRQMGALFGLLKGVLLCIIITFFAVTLLGQGQRQQIINSNSGYAIAHLLDKAKMVMPTELSQVLGPYLQKLDESLEAGGTDPDRPQEDGRDLLDAIADELREGALKDRFPSSEDIFPSEENRPLYREESNAQRPADELPDAEPWRR